jgi:hypothetical protein
LSVVESNQRGGLAFTALTVVVGVITNNNFRYPLATLVVGDNTNNGKKKSGFWHLISSIYLRIFAAWMR